MTDIDPYTPPESSVEDVAIETEPAYFTVGSLKLALLSICTLGLYELYWCYRNWKCIKVRLDLDIWPFWRAFFAPLWGFSLATHIQEHAKQAGLVSSLSPPVVGGAYLAISVLWRLPDPYWLVSTFTFLPLIVIQNAADRVAEAVDGKDDQLERVTVWNWFGFVFGGLFLALVVIGSFLPPGEP